ncbi:Protein-lysine N-methyltransferase efm4 [Ophidiomyces ophidiicola]|nr:Protein-lysine N-methyltransferase efm4 [Ophidiomyces ophidiicola]
MEKNEEHPEPLKPSELGTKEYWETFYARSCEHLDTAADDPDSDGEELGTTWFTEHRAAQRIVRFLTAPSFPLAPHHHHNAAALDPSASQQQQQPCVLDLGTGDGALLRDLRAHGFRGPLVGVDYSREAVQLARSRHDDNEDGAVGMRFEVWDVFDDASAADWFPRERGGFDIVLDKGTFDAVSLCGESGRGGAEYPAAVARLVRAGGFLVVTSCNWTEAEVESWFGAKNTGFEVFARVEYPKFRFGGAEGQGVYTVCFRKTMRE